MYNFPPLSQRGTLSARMLTSSESQWPAGQKGLRMSRAFTIFTKLVMTCIVGNTQAHLLVKNASAKTQDARRRQDQEYQYIKEKHPKKMTSTFFF